MHSRPNLPVIVVVVARDAATVVSVQLAACHIVASHLKKLLIFTHFIFGALLQGFSSVQFVQFSFEFGSVWFLASFTAMFPELPGPAFVALTTWNIVSALKRHTQLAD